MTSRLALMTKTWSRHLARLDDAGNNFKGFSRCLASPPSAELDSEGFSTGIITYALRFDHEGSHLRRRGTSGIRSRAYSSGQGTLDGPPGSGSEVFGNITSQSVVTDDMLDSLIALKDFGNIEGLPPLDVLLEEDDEKDRKAMRRELEMKKQLELEKTRVKTVDDLGRAYATGRRKESTARVWIKEGEGKIIINGKPHDLYFPDIDQRLQILEPFWQTSQLGVFDVRATVKGGGVSGQSGALRHGISKALQLFDPTLRPSLKSAGMLTRDSRVVERKKPGKAKARKSFQWVKR